MLRILTTETFRAWLGELRDPIARRAILARITRLRAGNFGDAKSVGDGVSELRVHAGPGWRVYFVRRGSDVLLLLCGGSKRTQAKDVERAKALASSDGQELHE